MYSDQIIIGFNPREGPPFRGFFLLSNINLIVFLLALCNPFIYLSLTFI